MERESQQKELKTEIQPYRNTPKSKNYEIINYDIF